MLMVCCALPGPGAACAPGPSESRRYFLSPFGAALRECFAAALVALLLKRPLVSVRSAWDWMRRAASGVIGVGVLDLDMVLLLGRLAELAVVTSFATMRPGRPVDE